ncbi:MAG: hypothetical protein JSU70_13775, partial [Phycisphaerales bacterium]
IEAGGKWLQSHFDEIRSRFVNQFAAITTKWVIAHDNNPEALIEKIGSKKEEPNDVLIQFIHKKNLKMLPVSARDLVKGRTEY